MSEVVGVIYKVGDTVQVSEKFRKREIIVLEEGGNPDYPSHLPFELTQDDVSKADGLSAGDKVRVTYFTNGRLWQPKDGGEERCFVSLKPSAVEVLEVSRSATKGVPPVTPKVSAPPVDHPVAAPDDDLPF